MKPSQKIAISSFALAAFLTGLGYLFWPHLYWWVYVLFAVIGGSLLTDTMLRFEADRKIVDRD